MQNVTEFIGYQIVLLEAELAGARVSCFDESAQTLRVNVGKTGARTIVLQSSAVKFYPS